MTLSATTWPLNYVCEVCGDGRSSCVVPRTSDGGGSGESGSGGGRQKGKGRSAVRNEVGGMCGMWEERYVIPGGKGEGYGSGGCSGGQPLGKGSSISAAFRTKDVVSASSELRKEGVHFRNVFPDG
jgi:hypothetical protein